MANSFDPIGRSVGFRPSSPPAPAGLIRRVAGGAAALLAAPVLALAAGVSLRSATMLIPDGEE